MKKFKPGALYHYSVPFSGNVEVILNKQGFGKD